MTQKSARYADRRRWYLQNIERCAEYGRQYRRRNKQKRAAQHRKYYLCHRKQHLARGKKWRRRQRVIALRGHNGRCGVCRTAKPTKQGWILDHAHSTNRFRGILCANCNLGLGHFKDNPKILRAAAKYLTARRDKTIRRQT